MMLGMAESRLGRPEKAVEGLERSLALGWSDTTAHFQLGRALLNVGRENEGVEHLKKAVELDSANSQAVYALMRVMSASSCANSKQSRWRLRRLVRSRILLSAMPGRRIGRRRLTGFAKPSRFAASAPSGRYCTRTSA
jgi:tetratricopeptide (TPR) repeat protein